MKNILKIIGAFLVLGVVFRLLRGGRRRFAGALWSRRMAKFGPAFGAMSGVRPVPIDDQWYRPAMTPSGPTRSVKVA
ncbi:hypothetical protein [Hymenobacter terricola]|uniref:hypothetical protein n=1 Tax=Hymenobacter terricola TaxID=2819236 RepID=UPI001B305661|nr:hypothetical protein [Hymenobacter terricola]